MKPPFIILQYLIPKQLITAVAGKLAHWRGGKLTTAFIAWFVKRYQVNMSEAAQNDIQHYKTFNEFFTRALAPNARPLANADFICPVDGAISQFGTINDGQIFQAKGHHYSTETLLAGNTNSAATFTHGHFATIYLSPRDYHRIHMPCDGYLKRMTYVPGDLFSVNPITAQHVPGLFARNERVVCEFETTHGAMVMVLVGATIVGSMATVWHGIVNPPRTGNIQEWSYPEKPLLKQGDEMGRFLLGSTIVVLLSQRVQFESSWLPERPVVLGEAMAQTI